MTQRVHEKNERFEALMGLYMRLYPEATRAVANDQVRIAINKLGLREVTKRLNHEIARHEATRREQASAEE